jgi:signal transduction histidine kinase
MRVETIILGFWAAAASAAALLVWRRCEKAGSENERLRSDLSAREDRERERISRLEHDLKSPLGVILGFAMLLREYVEEHTEDLPLRTLRSIDGIDQAAKKMLGIIESAGEGSVSYAHREEALVAENTRP